MHWTQGSPVWTKVLFSFMSAVIFAMIQRFSGNMQASTLTHALSNDCPRLLWGQ
jgi:hypothetical protein